MKDRLLDLLIEFDEMGYAPAPPCGDPERCAEEWKNRVLEEFKTLEAENAALRAELEEYEMIEGRKKRISQHRREDVRRVADKITRCCLAHCGHKVRIEAQDGFCIETCTYPPYHGKWIVEIEQCPKADETREAAEARLEELKGEKL